jgi:cysteine-S-conjugate beta-lyase
MRPLRANGLGGFDDLELDRLRERHSVKWRTFPPDVLPAFVAEMDFPVAPVVADAVTASLARGGDFGYALDRVVPELASAFAGFAQRRYGWTVDPDRVYVLPDVMRGVELWIDRFTGPGDGVIVNTPVYFPFLQVIRDSGRRVIEAPCVRGAARWELDLDALEAAFRAGHRLYLLCNPHNPTGRVLSRGDLSAVAELTERYDVQVVADEIHAPLVYDGCAHVPFPTLRPSAAQRTLTLHAASKAWNLAGLHCAVAVPDSAADAAYLSGLPYRTRGGAGILGIDATVAAFNDGEPWLDSLLTYLDGNRRLLGSLLAERFPSVDYVPPEATYLAWLDCRSLGLGDSPAQAFLDRARVAVNDGAAFGGSGPGFVRLNFGTSRALLTEAVTRMASACS